MEEKRQRVEIVLKAKKMEEVTCVGREGTESGCLEMCPVN